MHTQLHTFKNKDYSPQKNFIVQLLWYFTNILFFINPLNPISSIKVVLLRLFGAKIGQGVNFKPGINIKFPWLLEIGDYCWIGEKVWIDNLVKVKIGNDCCISQGAMLLTGSHNYKKSCFDLITGEITLKSGTWIGAQSVVCPGVTCEKESILAVNSVANKNLEPYGVYQGNPATYKRKREFTS